MSDLTSRAGADDCLHLQVHDCDVVVRVVEPTARLFIRCEDVPGWRCEDCGYEDPTADALERIHDLVLSALAATAPEPSPRRRPPGGRPAS